MASVTCRAVGWLLGDWAMMLQQCSWACFHGRGGVSRERKVCRVSWGLGMVGMPLFLLHPIFQSKAGSDPGAVEVNFLDGGAAKPHYKW